VALLVLAVAVLTPSVAGAGGWAVPSLDPVPEARAGQSLDVGFRLLQHGVTPIVAADRPGATVGLAVRVGDGTWFVPSTAGREPGHYVATVAVPRDAVAMDVMVQMRNGLFVDEAWARVAVAGATGSVSGSGDGWLPSWTVPLFGLLAAACVVLV